jgi:hypothetical protein
MNISRRDALFSTLFGAGLLGLRALATGLPAAVLANPRKALADGLPMTCAADRAQYLIMATSSLGDPLDCNVPGTYGDPGVLHPDDPTMAPTPLSLRGKTFTAAAPWASLPQSVLDRTCFFHNATTTPVHPKQPEVMSLNGAVVTHTPGGAQVPDMLISVLAAMLAPCLGTVQREPITLGAATPTEAVTYQGRVQPMLSPVGLRAILTDAPGPLTTLEKLRDADLDRMNALFRKDGTVAQRAFLDRYASSQGQVRALSQDLLSALSGLKDNSPASQVTAAVTMIRMNVAPVVTIHIPFGGDNHFDKALANEAAQTVAGVATIAQLMSELAAAGLSDKVTFVSANVFGRTKSVAHKGGIDGRDHNQNHHCAVLIGKGIAGGVIGGIAPMAGDYGALNIDSTTGAGTASGDIGQEDMMSAYGKTLGAAVGADGPTLDGIIRGGAVVKAALVALGRSREPADVVRCGSGTMTSATADTASAPASPPRAVEFFATGGLTLALFPLLWALRTVLGLDPAELAVGFLAFHGAHLINDPHFAVTYLLFYRDARARAFGDAFSGAQRLRYWVAGAVVPIALCTWAIVGLRTRSPATLGLLFELMFLLVGWHYVKQGFGVLVVLSARRGVTFSALERVSLLTHCFAGWALAWANPSSISREVEEKGVVYMTVPRPPLLEKVALAAFVASTAWLLATLVQKRLREGRLPIAAPLVGMLVSVWVWSILSSVDPLLVYVIPALHSVQYLYMVWLLARNEARAEEGPPLFGKPAAVRVGTLAVLSLGLGWVLFHGAPSLLDDWLVPRRGRRLVDELMGPTPYFAASFAVVNIHHYFMDHVIWRRENPLTRHLRS